MYIDTHTYMQGVSEDCINSGFLVWNALKKSTKNCASMIHGFREIDQRKCMMPYPVYGEKKKHFFGSLNINYICLHKKNFEMSTTYIKTCMHMPSILSINTQFKQKLTQLFIFIVHALLQHYAVGTCAIKHTIIHKCIPQYGL